MKKRLQHSSLIAPIAGIIVTALALTASAIATPEHPIACLLLALSCGVCVSIIIDACSTDSDRAVSLFSSLFFLVVVCVPGLIHSTTGVFPFFRKGYPNYAVTSAAFVTFLFIALFAAGLTASLRRRTTFSNGYTQKFSLNSARAIILILCLSVLALFAVLKFGIATITISRGESINIAKPIENIILVGGRYAGFFILWVNIYMIKSKKMAWLYALPLSITLYLIMANPISVPRTLTVGFIIIILVTIFPFHLKKLKTVVAIGYALSISLLLPLLNQVSRGSRSGQSYVSPIEYFSKSGDLDSFQSTVNVYLWIENVGIQWGKQFTSAAFVFIPRSVWQDKGLPTGQQAAAYAGYSYTNVSSPISAELFTDFGWFGPLFGGFLIGWLVGECDRHSSYARQSGRLTALLPYATVAAFSGILVRGSLIGVGALVAYAILISTFVKFIEPNKPKE